jgi:hypothetical protein
MYGAHHDRVDKVQSHCCLALGHVLSWSCVSGGTWWPPLYIISYVGRRLTFIVKPNSISNRVRPFWLLRVRTMTLSICLCCYIIDAINWSLPNGSISSSWLAPFPHNPSSSCSTTHRFLFFFVFWRLSVFLFFISWYYYAFSPPLPCFSTAPSQFPSRL